MVCVCIGIALELAVTSCVFPVTTDALLSDKLGAALAGAAQLAQGVAAREADSLCRDARGAAGAAGAAKGRSSAEAVAGSQQLHPAGCEDGGRAAEAGEAWQRQLPLQGGDMQIQPLPGGGAPSFALVQECADEVRGEGKAGPTHSCFRHAASARPAVRRAAPPRPPTSHSTSFLHRPLSINQSLTPPPHPPHPPKPP